MAVKTLFDPKVDDALMTEYMDELLVMSQLEHENVVSFLGASMTPPNLFFVMELCDASLFNMLHEQHAAFTTYERVQIACDVAAAMEYLHGMEPSCIIHRDLKSHNLLVSSRGIVKLCDFGLVKTRTTQAGTPAYMAPELLEGGSFNKSVDVYSFGVLLCELFSQEVPFAGYEIDDIRRAVTRGERPRIPTVDTPEPVSSYCTVTIFILPWLPAFVLECAAWTGMATQNRSLLLSFAHFFLFLWSIPLFVDSGARPDGAVLVAGPLFAARLPVHPGRGGGPATRNAPEHRARRSGLRRRRRGRRPRRPPLLRQVSERDRWTEDRSVVQTTDDAHGR